MSLKVKAIGYMIWLSEDSYSFAIWCHFFDEKTKLQSVPVMAATTTAGNWTHFINANHPSTTNGDLETFAAASQAAITINHLPWK